jgi:TonB family protein
MGEGDDDRPLAQGKSAASIEVPKQQERQQVAMRMDQQAGPGLSINNREEAPEVKGNSNRLNLSPGELAPGKTPVPGSRGKFGEAPLNLLPSTAMLNNLSGAAPNDDLQNVDEGEGTFLNTREWKYASFFNRLKQSIGYTWNPNEQIRLRDPTGQIYWGKDRDTLLRVTLDAQGRLKDVFVEKGSGLDFLDVEAMKAFERAQPFPNPPPGMVEADGTIKFAFGFKVILSNTPGVQLFRGAN